MLARMVATRSDEAAWSIVGQWLRMAREARGWTLVDVSSGRASRRFRRLIGDTRLRQIEVGYHPDGFPKTGTIRSVELSMLIRPGRLDLLLDMARRGLELPSPYNEPIFVVDEQPDAAGFDARDAPSPDDHRAPPEAPQAVFREPARAS